eukprot:4594197-Pyramimonas_sp.AAC.1
MYGTAHHVTSPAGREGGRGWGNNTGATDCGKLPCLHGRVVSESPHQGQLGSLGNPATVGLIQPLDLAYTPQANKSVRIIEHCVDYLQQTLDKLKYGVTVMRKWTEKELKDPDVRKKELIKPWEIDETLGAIESVCAALWGTSYYAIFSSDEGLPVKEETLHKMATLGAATKQLNGKEFPGYHNALDTSMM